MDKYPKHIENQSDLNFSKSDYEELPVIFALLEVVYGRDIDEFIDMRPEKLQYYIKSLPFVEARKNYQLAQLEATILNLMGGKGDGSKSNKPNFKLYNADERLVYFANMGSNKTISKLAAEVIKSNASSVPSWALDVIDWKLINNASETDLPLLLCTYHYMGESVIALAGFGVERDDNANITSFGAELVLVHPSLKQSVYKVKLGNEVIKFNLPDEMLMLSEPKAFYMQILPLVDSKPNVGGVI